MKRIITITLLLVSMLATAAAAKRALVVGISNYPASRYKDAGWGKIHGTNDAHMIQKTLKQQGFKTTLLTDKDATAQRIRQSLQRLQTEACRGDLVYIHFSCHGQPVEDQNGDEADGWDEAVVPYDALKIPVSGVYNGQNHIIDDELARYLDKLRRKLGDTGFVYVVVDACHSGGIDRGEDTGDGETFLRGTDTGFSLSGKKYTPRIDRRPNIPIKSAKGLAGICMLEACRSYQSNYELRQGNAYYGPLSFYINKTLSARQLTPDTSWVTDVKRQMDGNPILTRQNMVIQTTRQ